VSSKPPPVHAAPEQPGLPPSGDEPAGSAAAGLPVLGAGAVAVVVFAHLACDLFPGYVAPLLRHLRGNWELTRFQTAMLVLPGSLMIMFQPLIGLFADRMRTRAFVMGGVLMSALGYGTALPLAGLLGPGSGYLLAMVGIWIGAAGVSAYHPQGAALSGRASRGGSNHGAVALFVFAGTVGYGAGLFVPPLFIEPGRSAWIPCLTVLAVAALAGQALVPRLRPPGERLRRPPVGEVFGRLISDVRPVFWPLLVCWLIVVLRAATLQSFNQFTSIYYGEVLGLSSLAGAAAVAGFFMAQAAVALVAARLADRVGERSVLLASFLGGGAALGLSLLCSARGMTALSYACLLAGGGLLGGSVPLNVAVGQRLLPRSAAMGSGIMIGFAWGVGGLLVPLVARVGDAFGSTAAMLWTALTLAVPGAALALLMPARGVGGEPPPAPEAR
jgi:FSR family fosmidomycin resistance protein-like MFS transporter